MTNYRILDRFGISSVLCNPVRAHKEISMRKASILVTVLLLATLLLTAQQPAAQGAAKNAPGQALTSDVPSREQLLRLFEMLEIKKQMDSMRDTLAKTLEQQFAQMSRGQLSAKQKDEF